MKKQDDLIQTPVSLENYEKRINNTRNLKCDMALPDDLLDLLETDYFYLQFDDFVCSKQSDLSNGLATLGEDVG